MEHIKAPCGCCDDLVTVDDNGHVLAMIWRGCKPKGQTMDDKVVVLNDGETYTSLQGCVVLTIPAHVEEHDIDEWVKENAHKGLEIEGLLARLE